MSVELDLSDTLPLTTLVLTCTPPPGDAILRDAIRAWIDRYVRDDRHRALRARVDDLALLPCPAEQAVPLARRGYHEMWRPGVEEAAILHRARHGLFVVVHADPTTLQEDLALATAAARAVALHTGGVVVDPAALALEPLDDQRQPPARIVPAEDLVKVASFEEDGALWAGTLGLERLGLPELEVGPAPVHLLGDIAAILKRASRALLAQLETADRLSWLEVEGVRFGISRCGPMLRLHPLDGVDADVGPPLAELARVLGGAPADRFVVLDREDAAVKAATARARGELPEVRERFIAGLDPLARLFVCAVFTEGAREESLWLCVDRFTRHHVRGRLACPPYRASLKNGQRVSVPIDAILDWRIEHPDGRLEGSRLDEVAARSEAAAP